MNKRWWIGLSLPVLVGALIVVWALFHGRAGEDAAPSSESAQPTSAEPQPVRIEARWLFTGEVFWARQMERIAEAQPDPDRYLFSQLDTFDREAYDAWIGQLECPVADTVIPFDQQVNQLIFNCTPDYLPEFATWFDAVSLANNHMDNVDGVVGLEQTRANLDEAGVQYYGHFDNSVKTDICDVISLPVRLIYDDGSELDETFPVALCGYHDVFRLPTEEELAVLADYSTRYLTITSPQQGAEYEPVADGYKQNVYRRMIDHGADMVIASHPHWVQNTEVYKGRLIMYSVGNFMFDQEWSQDTKRGVSLDLTVTVPYEPALDTWMSFDCSEFHDTCAASAEDLMLAKPDFRFTYNLVSSYHENGLTRQASEAVHKLNLERTNWAATLSALGQ
jgi:poly-gamma-glutamate synthesis protein (capsule biosynthesis protein)